MKKYLLTLLTLFVILAPNVKAEECTNLLSSDINFYYSNKGSGGWHGGIAFLNKTVDGSSPEIITLDTSKTYTFYLNDGTKTFNEVLNYSYQYSSYFRIYYQTNISLNQDDLNKTSYTFNPTNKSFNVWFYDTRDELDILQEKLKNVTFWLVEGDSVCIPKTEPDPEPDPPVADATLDNFYSIYLSKLSSLATFATENKIFFSALGILLSFAIFELFFMLFRGRRKMK